MNSVFVESVALSEFHKSNCKKFMQNIDIANEIDYVNFLVSLHIVLEVSLNSFYRQLFHFTSMPTFNINRLSANEEIDRITFIDKTRFFIYCFSFDLSKVEKVKDHNKLIRKLKAFCEPRNKLLHGHSISTFLHNGNETWSTTKKAVTLDKCMTQLILFNEIMDIISFYLDCLNLNIQDDLKSDLKNQYLDKFYIIKKN